MTYATTEDVQARMNRVMSAEEEGVCAVLLEDAAVIIDTAAPDAETEKKKLVSCRMVQRVLGDGQELNTPIGATQGTVSALGYSQSWTIGNGSNGELYLAKTEKTLLGIGNKIGCVSPLEAMT